MWVWMSVSVRVYVPINNLVLRQPTRGSGLFFFFQLRPQQTCPASFIILRECAPLRSKHLSFKDIKSGTFCLFSYPWGC